MSERRTPFPSLVPAALAAALAVCGSAAMAADAPAKPPAPAAAGADAQLQRAYVYNTSYWSFSPAVDAYRDLSHDDEGVIGPAAVITARTYLAFNLATLSRLGEAQSALDQAQTLLAQSADQLTPVEDRLLRVNLLIGRSVVAGNRGAKATGQDRIDAFSSAANFADQAARLANAPLAQSGVIAVGASRDADAVVLDPKAALKYNLSNASGVLGGLLGQRMTTAEKLAELEARADYAASAALMAIGDRGRAAGYNRAAHRAMDAINPNFGLWLRALVEAQTSELQQQAGDTVGAERTLNLALDAVRRAHGLSRPEAYLLRRQADLQVKLGRLADAKASQERSFQILLDQTDGVQPTRREVAPYLSLLAPSAVAGDKADVARFFTVSSVATETATAATIANVANRFSQGDSASAQAIRDLQSARAELERATARLTRVNEPKSGATATQIRGAEDDERAARARVALAVTTAEKAGGTKAAAVVSPKTDLAEIQAVLAPDEAYVRFIFLDDGAGYAILIRRSDARLVKLPLTEAEAARKVADLRASTQVTDQGAVPGFRLTRSAEVYQNLFGGIDADLKDVRHLDIEPAGPLFSLPFAALLTRPADADLKARFIASRGVDYTGAPWLARDKTLETSVGSAAFVRLRQVKGSTAPNPIFAFADPTPTAHNAGAVMQVGALRESRGLTLISSGGAAPGAACADEARGILGFEPLPDSLTEAQSAIHAFGADADTDVLAGATFTDTAVKARTDLKSYRVLLFATHAALPNQARCWPDPFLITTKAASDPGSDGVLDTMEIGGLNLDANLVVLSACDTAAGDSGGQALGGLAQSFFFAGSRAVLVSHWAVNSRATAALITGVLAADAKGEEPGKALADAERSLMDNPALSHPYYWAAFALVGGVEH